MRARADDHDDLSLNFDMMLLSSLLVGMLKVCLMVCLMPSGGPVGKSVC